MKRKFFTFKPFLDMLFCVLMMLIAILFLLKTEEKETTAREPNAIYEVVLTWEGKSETDLDLYVQLQVMSSVLIIVKVVMDLISHSITTH